MGHDTEQREAITDAVLDRMKREASNHTKPTETDDLPITRRNLKLGWALVVGLAGVIVTGAGGIYTTASSAADARHTMADNAKEIAALKAWQADRVREAAENERRTALALSEINTKLAVIMATQQEQQKQSRKDRQR